MHSFSGVNLATLTLNGMVLMIVIIQYSTYVLKIRVKMNVLYCYELQNKQVIEYSLKSWHEKVSTIFCYAYQCICVYRQ